MDRRGHGAIGRWTVLIMCGGVTALLGPGAKEVLSSSDLEASNELVRGYLSRKEMRNVLRDDGRTDLAMFFRPMQRM